jgi:hypothetical protein
MIVPGQDEEYVDISAAAHVEFNYSHHSDPDHGI